MSDNPKLFRSEAELAALPTSERIRYRLIDANRRYHANDNIAEHIREGELTELKAEVQANLQRVLRSLVIDTDSDHNTQDTAKRVAKMFIEERGIRVLDLTQPAHGKLVDSGRLGGAFQQKRKDVDILFQKEVGSTVETVVGGEIVRLAAVHVAGFYKNHMPGLTGWSWAIFRSFFRPNYRKNIKQLFWYGLNGFRYRRYLKKNYEELQFGSKEC